MPLSDAPDDACGVQGGRIVPPPTSSACFLPRSLLCRPGPSLGPSLPFCILPPLPFPRSCLPTHRSRPRRLAAQVPNMFPYDERAAVQEQCRAASKKEGLDLESAVDLWWVHGPDGTNWCWKNYMHFHAMVASNDT